MPAAIPQRFQLFIDGPVVVSDKDAERLAPYLGGWLTLNEFFIAESPTEEDLKRLVVMELMGDRREYLINKLLARLSGVIQRRWHKRIGEVVDLVAPKRRGFKDALTA
jgi:hypothetical protein